MKLIAWSVLWLGCGFPLQIVAEVYRCHGVDGHPVYTQIPCGDVNADVVRIPLPETVPANVCSVVYDYSLNVARRMQSGISSETEKSALTGDHVNSTAVHAVIDYTHSFVGQPDVSAARIASLSMNKCRNGGFGALQADDLPRGKSAWSDRALRQNKKANTQRQWQQQRQKKQRSQVSGNPSDTPQNKTDLKAHDAGDAQTSACDAYQRRLRQVNQLRRLGYTVAKGEKLRRQRQRYQELVRSHCR